MVANDFFVFVDSMFRLQRYNLRWRGTVGFHRWVHPLYGGGEFCKETDDGILGLGGYK